MRAFHDKDTGAQPTPSTIPQRAMDTDTSGIISTYQRNGDTQTSSNAFFENLGTNGRTWLPPDANGLVGDPLAGNPTNAQFTPNIFNFFGLDQPFWNGWRQSKSLGGRTWRDDFQQPTNQYYRCYGTQ